MRKFWAILVALTIAIIACISMVGCSDGETGDGGNGGGDLTRAELAVVYKTFAVSAWDKLGLDNPKEETSGAMLMSATLPDNRVETSNDGEIMNIKMNAALMANVAYMIGDLYANDNFNLTNNLVYFDATSTMEGQSHSHAFKIETYLDLDADKLYFEGVINTDGMDQYSYLVADFDFDTNTLKSFRFCCSVVGNYVDMGLSESNEFLFYSPTEQTDEFVIAMNAAKSAFEVKAASLTKLSGSFDAEVQSYIDAIMKLQGEILGI